MVNNIKVIEWVNAMRDKFENKVANKKDDITGDFSTDSVSYPTVKAVKAWVTSTLGSYASSSHTHGNVSNDGKIGTTSGKIITTGTGGALQASDSITKSQISDFPSTMTPSSHSHGDITNDGKVGTTSGKPLITGTGGAVQAGSFGSSSGTFAEGNHTHSQYLTAHQSLSDIGGVVTVEKQTTPETGYAATYLVKQNGVQVGSKINILKDNFLNSVTKKTVGSTPTSLETENNLSPGDVYLEFIVSTADGTTNAILVSMNDFLDNVNYTAGSGLTLTNNQFSISNGAISKAMLATAVQTSLGYADNWNSSAAKGITSTDISNWNNAGSSNLTISDVDDEIDAYLDAMIAALD